MAAVNEIKTKQDKSMENLKKYRFVSAVFLFLLAAVLYRSFNHSVFRYDAPKLAGLSFQGSNIVTEDQIPGFQNALIIDLNNPEILKDKYSESTLKVNPDSILEKKNIRRIIKNRGPVILVSSENTISARIWMLLSQKGIKNIFILSEEKDFEVLKNKFRPDTLSVPELI
jgi:hypothetical protein